MFVQVLPSSVETIVEGFAISIRLANVQTLLQCWKFPRLIAHTLPHGRHW